MNKIDFFIKNDSLATENAILTTVANNFLWESTHLELRFRKPRKKNFELFERKITFLKIFLCTCIKVVVTTLPKFCRQNSEKFLLDFRKWGKYNKPSKKFICKNLRLNMSTNFWQACRNHACKSTKDLFRSKSENDSNANFSKRSIFSFISLLQKLKKNTSSGHAECGCDHPARKILSEFWKPFARIPEMMNNLGEQSLSPRNVRLTCTMKFWQAWPNFVANKRKTFPNYKNVEVTIFWENSIFLSKTIL